MENLEDVKERVLSGDMSVDDALKMVRNESLFDADDSWELGLFIYTNFTRNSMSEESYIFASRANYRKDCVVVMADSSPDNYWGIQRDAKSQLWRPFYKGLISKFYFIQKKFSGVGWTFAFHSIGDRLLFVASSIVNGEVGWFCWELRNNIWSPITVLTSPEDWFSPYRVGSYVITEIEGKPDGEIFNKSIGFKKQHEFTGVVDTYAVNGDYNNIYVEVHDNGSFNHYIGYGIDLNPGWYCFKQVPLKSTPKYNNTR